MKTGVCLRPEYEHYSLETLARLAQRAEQNGFDSVWLTESWGLDAIALLAHLGARTRSIRLGTAIVNVFSRSPALLAMAATTLNDLYPGRFILGLGTSTKQLVEGFHAMRFERPLTRLRDTVSIVRQAVSGREIDHVGPTATVRGYRLRVTPNAPPPPIYLAALGAESIRHVAEAGDGWIPYLLPIDGISAYRDRIRAAAVDAGRDAGAVCIAPLVLTAVADDRDTARQAAREHLAFYLGAMGPHYREFVADCGYRDEVAAVRDAWSAKNRPAAFAAVSDPMLDAIAICGTPPECRDKLARVRAAGADLPILFFPGTCTERMVELAIDSMHS